MYNFTKQFRASGQDVSVGKYTHILLQPNKKYNQATEQPSFRTAWNLAEWKSYNCGYK